MSWSRVSTGIALACIALLAIIAGTTTTAILCFAVLLIVLRYDIRNAYAATCSISSPNQRAGTKLLIDYLVIQFIVGLICIVVIRSFDLGLQLVLVVALCAIATDTASHIVGCSALLLQKKYRSQKGSMKLRVLNALSHHPKILANVSPNKTVIGFASGLLIGTIVTCVAIHYLLGHTVSLAVIIASAIMCIAAQLGDLYESKVKREVGVKDFAEYLGGHGAISDRLDSVSAVAPIAMTLYVIAYFL